MFLYYQILISMIETQLLANLLNSSEPPYIFENFDEDNLVISFLYI